MKVDGLHHVTVITDIETNLDFYARLLGLRSAGGRVVKPIGDEVLYTPRRALGMHDCPQPREDLDRPSRCSPGARRCGRRRVADCATATPSARWSTSLPVP